MVVVGAGADGEPQCPVFINKNGNCNKNSNESNEKDSAAVYDRLPARCKPEASSLEKPARSRNRARLGSAQAPRARRRARAHRAPAGCSARRGPAFTPHEQSNATPSSSTLMKRRLGAPHRAHEVAAAHKVTTEYNARTVGTHHVSKMGAR